MTYSLAIHGGASSIPLDINQEEYCSVLTASITAGINILEKNGSSIDAIIESIIVLENSPLFNSGCGASLNADGVAELDASIMDGKTLNAGAVSASTKIKNPIIACKKIMEESPHILLTSQGANIFAKKHNLEIVENDYFITKARQELLLKSKNSNSNSSSLDFKFDNKGTVGAVALDKNGNLAAGTSTGGLTNKAVGRVGDSPNIGQGTYAENGVCAISNTGDGDEISRIIMAHDIACQIKYANKNPKDAANNNLDKLKEIGGEGGVIMITANGEILMPFNSKGMFRGSYSSKNKEIFTAVF